MLSVCFKTWSWLKGVFLPEYFCSTGFVFAVFEYLVSGFQLENSYRKDFFFSLLTEDS